MTIEIFLQQVINGFSLGSMYALIAIGYTMVYGILRLINFAHGDIMMVGSFSSYFALSSLGSSFFVSVLFSIVVAVILGILTDKIAYKPLRRSPRISLLITAIGISFFLENAFTVFAGGMPRGFDVPPYLERVISISFLSFPLSALLVPVSVFIILSLVLLMLHKTKYGMAIRASSFDLFTVNLMGIDSDKVIMVVFALGSGLAAIGGVFWVINYPTVEPMMGVLVGLKAFAAAVVGGIGSVTGAVLGGFIIGFTEVIMVSFFPDLSGYKDAFAFVLLIFVLIFRPTGVLGKNFESGRF